MEGDQSHNLDNAAVVAVEGKPTPSSENPSKAPSTESASDHEPHYTPIDVLVKEVKYSDKSQREYTTMRISEGDRHLPKFALPYNSELLVMAPMGIFLSDVIIRKIRRHMNAYGREKVDRFRAVSDS